MIAEEQSSQAPIARRRIALLIAPLITLATLATLLLGWQLVAASGLVPDYFVPSPRQVWQAFVVILHEGFVSNVARPLSVSGVAVPARSTTNEVSLSEGTPG